jgi:alkanesulfonate monooxygenase SsuD/methylene tetrahydromethanopterin reductase-like flavin-dependent oxidoreductase (luciferase family)
MDLNQGLTLSSEEHPPARLVEIARLAEQTGFDFVSISDHFHPWISEQGHAPSSGRCWGRCPKRLHRSM